MFPLKFHILVILLMIPFSVSTKSESRNNHDHMSATELIEEYNDDSDEYAYALSLKEVGVEALRSGKMVDAMKLLVVGMTVAERGGHNDLYDACAANLSIVYNYFGEYGSSAYYGELAFESAKNRGDSTRSKIAANNLFQTYCAMSDTESAERIYSWMKKNPLMGNIGKFRDIFNGYLLQEKKQDFARAHKMALSLDSIVNSDRTPVEDRAAAAIVKGESFLNIGMHDSARIYALRGLELSSAPTAFGLRLEALSLLVKISDTLGDEKEKEKYESLRTNEEDSIVIRSEYYAERQRLIKFENETTLKSIVSLNTKIREQTKWIVTIALFAVVLIAALIVIWNVHSRLKGSYRALYDKSESLMKESGHTDIEAANGDAGNCKNPTNEDGQYDKLLKDIIRVLNDSETLADSEFTLYKLARAVGSNTHYVSTMINSRLGKSFSNYINEKRIMTCCNMIKSEPDIKISDLWVKAGFGTMRNFQVSFKRIMGMPPSAYKAIVKEQAKP